MSVLRGFFASLCLLVVLGCGSEPPISGPPPEMWLEAPWAPPGKGVISFCRPGRYMGWALNTSVYVDGVEIADLDNGTLVHVAVDPGRRMLYSDEENDATGLQVEAGKQYFYIVQLAAGVWKGHGVLIQVSGNRGRAECSKVKRGKDIRRPDMVVDAPR